MERLPLQGIRIADFSWAWAGPYCSLQLAFMGAEVIKIESRRRLDMNRQVGPYIDDVRGPNRGGSFNTWNQGKLSITLNLSTPEGVDLAKRLVSISDVVIENMTPGVMDRLGLGYEELVAVKPDIIMVSLSGFGAYGPMKSNPAFGTPLVFMSGLASLTGYPGGEPRAVGISYPDPNAGLHAAFVILSALWYRKQTGKGQYIDLSEWEAVLAIMPEGIMETLINGREPPRIGNRDFLMAPYGCYPCQGDDEWVTIAVGSDAEWRALADAIGRPELACDPRYATAQQRKANEDELDAILSIWTQKHTKWEIAEALQRSGVAAFPTMNCKDLSDDPHLNERGFFIQLDHAEVGLRKHTGVGWKLAATPATIKRPAPLLGEDNDYVFKTLLGLSDIEIEDLTARQVLF